MTGEADTEQVQQMSFNRLTATFKGRHQPIISSEVAAATALADARLVEMRHNVVQDQITLVIEVDVVSNSPQLALLYRSLLAIALKFNLNADFATAAEQLLMKQPQQLQEKQEESNESSTIEAHSSNDKVIALASPVPYVLTLLSKGAITPDFLSKLESMLCECSFTTKQIKHLSSSGLYCIELVAARVEALTPTDINCLRKRLHALGNANGTDVALQAESMMRQSKKLVVLDMDGTLIQQEVIDELARYAGVYEQVGEITHRAMRGELDYQESLCERVALLKGANADIFQKVIHNLHYTTGAKQFCQILKKRGFKLAVISGGFARVTSHVKKVLGLDHDYGNYLEVRDGKFTGRTIGTTITADIKAELLTIIARRERITLDQVVAIGDGANDVPMLSIAGLGIAFNAKAAVQEAAKFRINQPSLMAVLYLLGLSDYDQTKPSEHEG